MSTCCALGHISPLRGTSTNCADMEAPLQLQSPGEGSSAEGDGAPASGEILPLDALPQRRMQPSRNWLDDGDVRSTAIVAHAHVEVVLARRHATLWTTQLADFHAWLLIFWTACSPLSLDMKHSCGMTPREAQSQAIKGSLPPADSSRDWVLIPACVLTGDDLIFRLNCKYLQDLFPRNVDTAPRQIHYPCRRPHHWRSRARQHATSVSWPPRLGASCRTKLSRWEFPRGRCLAGSRPGMLCRLPTAAPWSLLRSAQRTYSSMSNFPSQIFLWRSKHNIR